MDRSGLHIIPTSRSGKHGWTLCCDAAADFSADGHLCCKACWSDVEQTPAIVGLDLILAKRERGDLTITAAIAAQRALLDRLTAEHFEPNIWTGRPQRVVSSNRNFARVPEGFVAAYKSRYFPGVGAGR